MPRVSDSSTEEQTSTPKRARTKSPARKSATKRTTTTARKKTTKLSAGENKTRVPRRRTTAKATPNKSVEVAETAQERVLDEVTDTDTRQQRKAPTKFAAEAKKVKTKRIQFMVVAGVLVVGIGASAAIGVTDAGRIDVAQTIQERNARIGNLVDVDGPVTVAESPVTANAGIEGVPDGGLIGLQPTVPKPATPMTAAELEAARTANSSTTASTTSATSTEPIATDLAATTTESSQLEIDGVTTSSATTTVDARATEVVVE